MGTREVHTRPRDLAVDAAAAYRLTRLVTADTITRPARARLIAWAYEAREINRQLDAITYGEEHTVEGVEQRTPQEWEDWVADDATPPKLAELITCRWCAGLWISLAIIAARRYCPTVWDPFARALAVSAAAALAAGLEQ